MKKTLLSNTAFDFTKWLAIAGLPAIGVAYGQLANIWGLPYGKAVSETLDIIGVLLAAFLAWQNYDYTQKHTITITPNKEVE